MNSEEGLTLKEASSALGLIELRKGQSSNMSLYQHRDYLVKAINDVRRDIELVKKENDVLYGFMRQAELVKSKVDDLDRIDVTSMFKNSGKLKDIKDAFTQTDPLEKIIFIKKLIAREKMLLEELASIEKMGNYDAGRINRMLVKIREHDDIKGKSETSSSYSIHHGGGGHLSSLSTPQPAWFNQQNVDMTTPASASFSNVTSNLNEHNINNNNNNTNGVAQVHEESDDEGVQLLLSMKRNVFNCKCGEYLNSITDWSEHQKTCSRSTEKTIGEQCKLCNKTFSTCVALNIHSTKKHNKKKLRTDSVMHCPCGQSFHAKWRQNCVYKLNVHGKSCEAFKERETQCSICKKGFIDRKSLEYHGLKAHKLAVPVNS